MTEIERCEKEIDNARSFLRVIAQSTCKKRVTVCEIYDLTGTLLSRESNRCQPPNGECSRIGKIDGKAGYPISSDCGWTHAEIMAIRALPSSAAPVKAVIFGHDFACPGCEAALRAIGVREIVALGIESIRAAKDGLEMGLIDWEREKHEIQLSMADATGTP